MSTNNNRNNTKRLSGSPPVGAPTAPRAMREQQALAQRVTQQRAAAAAASTAEAARGAGPATSQGQGSTWSFLPLLPPGQISPEMCYPAPDQEPCPNPQRNASAESQQPTAGQHNAAYPGFLPAYLGNPNNRPASADEILDGRQGASWQTLTPAPQPETEEQKAEREKAQRIASSRQQFEQGRSFEDDKEFFPGNAGNRSRKA